METAEQRIKRLQGYLDRQVLDFDARLWVWSEIWDIKMTARYSGQ